MSKPPRGFPLFRFMVSITLLGMGPDAATAQGVRGRAEIGISHARPPSGVAAEPATYLLGGGRLSVGPLLASAYGGLAPDEGSGSWGAGSLGLAGRAAVAPWLDFSLAVLGSGFRVGDPTPYQAATARALPEVRFSTTSVWLALRGEGGLGQSKVADVVSDLWLYGGGLEVGRRFGPIAVRLGADYHETETGSYGALYGGGWGRLASLEWQVDLRLWRVPGGDTEGAAEIGLSIPLGGSWSLGLAGGRRGPDPLLGTPPATAATALLSREWGALTGGAVPLYTLDPDSAGNVIFRLRRPDADRVSVVGDFTDWEPVSMTRRGALWVARMPVPPGVYHFGFLVDGAWFVPEDASGAVNDEFGRRNATLVVW